MDKDAAQRLNIDIERCQQHRELILQNIEEFATRTSAIFQNSDFPEISDPDGQLYSGGFFSRDDSQRIDTIRKTRPEKLAGLETLDEQEHQQWNNYRHEKFSNPATSHRTMNQFLAEIDAIQQAPDTVGSQLVLLEDLLEYAKSIKI
jgi:exodeoxyribonuclease-1